MIISRNFSVFLGHATAALNAKGYEIGMIGREYFARKRWPKNKEVPITLARLDE